MHDDDLNVMQEVSPSGGAMWGQYGNTKKSKLVARQMLR